jgi:hypothetical protein
MGEARRRTKVRRRDAPNDVVAATFASYPPRIRRKLAELRSLIFATVEETDGVGAIETLKSNEPAHVRNRQREHDPAPMEAHAAERTRDVLQLQHECRVDVSRAFRRRASLRGKPGDRLRRVSGCPKDVLRVCIEAALTYHKQKS